jgi:hypothetical protein
MRRPRPLDALLDHLRPADQRGLRQTFIGDYLHRAQHALVLALGVDHAPRRPLGRREQRLHDQARVVDELRERGAVVLEVGDRARRHARVHRRLGHRRRDLGDQARVEGPRDQVFGPELEVLAAVGERHDVGGLGLRELGDRVHRRQLHLAGDGGGADVERAAEDETGSRARCSPGSGSPRARWR